MNKNLTIFLQAVIVIFGGAVLAALLAEPHFEGVNAHAASLSDIYFDDPFLAYVYLASIPFFVALYHAFQVLGYARKDQVFSPASIKALRTIKYCAFFTAGAIVAADIFLLFMARKTGEDAAGALMLGMIATLVSVVSAAGAAVFERMVQNGASLKSENDLTV